MGVWLEPLPLLNDLAHSSVSNEPLASATAWPQGWALSWLCPLRPASPQQQLKGLQALPWASSSRQKPGGWLALVVAGFGTDAMANPGRSQNGAEFRRGLS